MAFHRSVFILLNRTPGIDKSIFPMEQRYIMEGELLVKIPERQQVIERNGEPPYNYCLLRNRDVTMYESGSDVDEITEEEAEYLEAVDDLDLRLSEYRNYERMQWIMSLRVGDAVYFELKRAPIRGGVKGMVRYYGEIETYRGVMFGIEIMDSTHRGKGFTNGRPYFSCRNGDGVFVSMHEILNMAHHYSTHDDMANVSSQNTFSQYSQMVDPQATQTSTNNQYLGVKQKVDLWNKKAETATNTSERQSHQQSQHSEKNIQSKFSPGDQVVVQNVKERPITGKVRWVGPLKSRNSIVIPVLVGIETDEPVDPEMEFPGIHFDMKDERGQQLFNIDFRYHGRLFLPEAMVLSSDEYAKQKQDEEAEEAKMFGFSSVKEYRRHKELEQKFESQKKKQTNETTLTRVHEAGKEINVTSQQYTSTTTDDKKSKWKATTISDDFNMLRKEDIPQLVTLPCEFSHLTIGTSVVVPTQKGSTMNGTIRWIGKLPGFDGFYAGVELNDVLETCGDGSFDGEQYFTCLPGRGYFCTLSSIQPEKRHSQEVRRFPPKTGFQKENSSPSKAEHHALIEKTELLEDEVEQLKKKLQEQTEKYFKMKQDYEREKSEHQRTKEEMIAAEHSWIISHTDIQQNTQKPLGTGAWGHVFTGTFRHQEIAIKQLHVTIISDQNINQIQREIYTMSRLRHPNLLLFIGAVFDDPSYNPLILTEKLDTTLRTAYETKRLATNVIKLTLLRDTATGLEYLHDHHEIIHRDVSSANVLLESRGQDNWRAKLSDFGSANFISKAMSAAPGAQVYSAPELLRPIDKPLLRQTPKADVYSFGILTCEVLANKFPENNETFRTMKGQVRRISSGLDELITHCIVENLDGRPEIKEVISRIDIILEYWKF